MITGYVGDQIRRANRRLLFTNIVMIGLILGVVFLTIPYIVECLRGPFPMTTDQIAKLGSKGDAAHRFITVDINRSMLDRQGYHIQGGQDHKDDYYHFLHLPDHRTLIVKNYAMELPAHLQGSLSILNSDVNDRVVPGVAGQIQGSFLPVMVDTSSYRSGLWIMMGVGIPLLLLGVWNLVKAALRMADPARHPMVKQLALMGPPDEIAVAVDAEVREGGAAVGKVLATRSWLIRPTAYSTDLLYLGDIAWAYKHETVHKSYGVTTRRTYATIIHDVRGKKWNFPLNQQQVETLLRELAARVPWAIIGFNAQLKAAWQKNRKDVLAQIEARKQQLTSGAQPGAAPGEPPQPQA